MNCKVKFAPRAEDVTIPVSEEVSIQGSLSIVEGARGIVIFAHSSSSKRFSSRNCFVTEEFNSAGLSTLLVDLLTDEEEKLDMQTGELRFDIDLLTARVKGCSRWVMDNKMTSKMKIGYFGTGTGVAATLTAAGHFVDSVKTVVSCGGRCDLAEPEFAMIKAPVLFIAGEKDTFIRAITQNAMDDLSCEKKLTLIESAGHLFEEPGAIEEVTETAAMWFAEKLCAE